jgi:hypothetical protein
MKEYSSDNPVFSSAIEVVEATDPGHADNINKAPEQLMQNDLVIANALDVSRVDEAFKKEFSNLEEDTTA